MNSHEANKIHSPITTLIRFSVNTQVKFFCKRSFTFQGDQSNNILSQNIEVNGEIILTLLLKITYDLKMLNSICVLNWLDQRKKIKQIFFKTYKYFSLGINQIVNAQTCHTCIHRISKNSAGHGLQCNGTFQFWFIPFLFLFFIYRGTFSK